MIRLIAAIDQKRGIAKAGVQPWYIPDDEHYFTEQTKTHGGVVVMGQTTASILHGPLVERTNYVLTHDPNSLPSGFKPVSNLTDFLADFGSKDLWVIGGANVFGQFLSIADELYLTRVAADFGCDLFFPEYEDMYRQSSQSEPKTENGFNYHFSVWQRK